MEKSFKIDDFETREKLEAICSKNSGITKAKIIQNKPKSILLKQNDSKHFKINKNNNSKKFEKNILNNIIKVPQIKLIFKIKPKDIKKPPYKKNHLRTNSYFLNKFKIYYEILILLLINLSLNFVKLNQEKIIFKLSEITLKVKGTDYIKILSDSFFQKYNQCEIYINGILQNITNFEYYFNDLDKIDWDTTKNKYNYSEIDTNKTDNEYYLTDLEVMNIISLI